MNAHSSVPAATLLGVPYDLASSYARGSADGPPAIREALRVDSSNAWSELGIDTSDPAVLADAGDVAFADGADPRAAIDAAADALLARGERPLALGGDHSVTYPLVRAARRHATRLTIVHFDAHPDLYDAYEGDRYSHACPFARIMEEGHASRLVQVGIRTRTAHQREQAKRFGVETIAMAAWSEIADLEIDGPLYVSVDLDVLDPAFVPGISHPEPGGCSVRQLVDALHLIHAFEAPIVAADVVELNPRFDVRGRAALVAAKVVKELAAMMHERRP